MNNGTNKHWPWIFATAFTTLVAATSWQATFAKPNAEASPGVCKQWQTATLAPVVDINGTLPEMGKPHIDTAPEGWEPFAFGAGGQLVYKRCAK